MNIIISFIITFISFVILDGSWIFYNFDYYMTLCKKIQKEPFYLKIPSIIISYIILCIALLIYLRVITLEINAQKKYNKYLIAIIYGCLFGLVIYGTYSFTSCTYYKNYSYYDALIDTTWGMILFSLMGILFVLLN